MKGAQIDPIQDRGRAGRRRTLKREIRRRERFARNRDLNASTRRQYANYSS